MTLNLKKITILSIGWLSLALGCIGIFLPILPTTPFLILTGICFSHASPRLHQWLLSLPLAGPAIVQWEAHGTIHPKAKTLAVLTIIICFSITFYISAMPLFGKVGLGLIGVGAITFILSRPSHPKNHQV